MTGSASRYSRLYRRVESEGMKGAEVFEIRLACASRGGPLQSMMTSFTGSLNARDLMMESRNAGTWQIVGEEQRRKSTL
jgi:hypothetical protein